MSEKLKKTLKSPFTDRFTSSKQSNFDKYYDEVEYKDVYRKAGIDAQGEEFGVIEIKVVNKRQDIAEYINSQADTVGVEAYMRALTVQGDSIENYNTEIDMNKVNDYSQMPDTLADVMTSGDKAKEAFAKLDPALKGSHTTIEGFLGSLTQEKLDAYIKGKVDAYLPNKEVVKEGV